MCILYRYASKLDFLALISFLTLCLSSRGVAAQAPSYSLWDVQPARPPSPPRALPSSCSLFRDPPASSEPAVLAPPTAVGVPGFCLLATGHGANKDGGGPPPTPFSLLIANFCRKRKGAVDQRDQVRSINETKSIKHGHFQHNNNAQ